MTPSTSRKVSATDRITRHAAMRNRGNTAAMSAVAIQTNPPRPTALASSISSSAHGVWLPLMRVKRERSKRGSGL